MDFWLRHIAKTLGLAFILWLFLALGQELWAYLCLQESLAGQESAEALLAPLEKASALSPWNADYHYKIALAHERLGWKSWNAALASEIKEPGSLESSTSWKHLMVAITHYRKAVSLQPTGAANYRSLGWLYGNLAAANASFPGILPWPAEAGINYTQGYFEQALALAPRNYWSHRLYGLWAFEQAHQYRE